MIDRPNKHSPPANHIELYKQLRGKDIKSAITNVLKASFAMVAGWTFSIWLLFLLISSIALITQA
jgi:hypothetical protein